jgi:molecular chaperone GrpE
MIESWLQGALLTEGRLLALFERGGVRPIATVGLPFDPLRHVAVAVARDGRVPDGTVVDEELRGYTAGDRVLRHAEVVVARATSPAPTAEPARTARVGGGEGSTGAGTVEGDAR